MQAGIQFFPDIGPDVRSARDYWQRGAVAGRAVRPLRLQPRPHGRALLPPLWRLQPQSRGVPRRGRAGDEARAPGDRRRAAGVQPSAEARRRTGDAGCAVRRPARHRLRARLPAARVRTLRREAGREPRALRRGRRAGAAAAGAGERHLRGTLPQLPRRDLAAASDAEAAAAVLCRGTRRRRSRSSAPARRATASWRSRWPAAPWPNCSTPIARRGGVPAIPAAAP